MKPMKALIALALAGAWSAVPAAQEDRAPDVPLYRDGAQAGFFVVPVRPLAYSFADICNLTIEQKPQTVPTQTAANSTLAAPGLSSIWQQPTKPQPAAMAAEAEPAAAAPQRIDNSRPRLLGSVPEPADWMQLCGFAIVALIAKRRRDWSVRRALTIGKTSRLRPRDAGRESAAPIVRLD